MSASAIKRYSGHHDFQLGELRNARVHIYDTVAHANADASSANNRFCFISETNRFYMGRSNAWLKIESIGEVSTPSNLPTDETNGATYVVEADPSIHGGPNVYILQGGTWYPVRDNNYPSQIVLKTSTATLVSSSRLYVKLDSTSGEFTLTLPATAMAGDIITFKDVGGLLSSNPVFLAPGSQTVDGLSSTLELNRRYQCLVIQYIENHWMVIQDA